VWETKGGEVRGSGGVDVQKGRGLGLPVRLLESCGDGYALLELYLNSNWAGWTSMNSS